MKAQDRLDWFKHRTALASAEVETVKDRNARMEIKREIEALEESFWEQEERKRERSLRLPNSPHLKLPDGLQKCQL